MVVFSDARTPYQVRCDYPILVQSVHGHRLVYLDNAATMQVPLAVLDAVRDHYLHDNANVHRGIHTLSERSTIALENAREKVAAFIGAPIPDQVVFTSGTTGAINTVARLLAPEVVPGMTIVVTAMEHHANFVPWQQLCLQTGATFAVAPLDKRGDLDLESLEALLGKSVFLLAVTHVSNVLGTVNPVKKIVEMAHAHGTRVLIDAAQSIRHEPVDVRDLDCDFLCFSGHKTGALTGIGVLYGTSDLLAHLRPVDFGGEMVATVDIRETTFEDAPLRYEAGTPNYVGAISLGAACDYLNRLGRAEVHSYERELLVYAEAKLAEVDGVHILGNPRNRAGCLSFVADGVHPFDLATLLDKRGVAVRSGNQCAQPLLHEVLGTRAVTRLSPAFYNTVDDIDVFIDEMQFILPLLRR